MYIKHILFGASCLMLSASWMSGAQAASATGSLQVKIQIGQACELKSGDKSLLDFGTVDKISPAAPIKTAEANSIDVQCSKGVTYKIGLGMGQNSTGDLPSGTRRMKSGTEYVPYTLLTAVPGQQQKPWGPLSTTYTVSGTGDGTIQKYAVGGMIPNGNTLCWHLHRYSSR